EQQRWLDEHPHTVCFVVKDIAMSLGRFSDWFYEHPSQRIRVVGITGTNGKTSTAFYTAQLLDALGKKTALIGTLGNGVFMQGTIQTRVDTRNTTPDAVSVHRLLAEFASQGVDWVMMEVSSHALELGRVSGVVFDTVVLTQVTRDHMDFHGTLEAYQQAKKKLFTDYPARVKVLNAKDGVGQELITMQQRLNSENQHSALLWTYSVEGADQKTMPSCHVSAYSLVLNPHGMQFQLGGTAIHKGGGGINKPILVPLLGAFNVENILCALSIVLAGEKQATKKEGWQTLVEALLTLQAVSGRMQSIHLPSSFPTVLVDFAHTPDALEQVLTAVKQHVSANTKGRLWVVFGCGGNRDQGKRPFMAQVAERIADEIMVTSDNPRFESPEKIIEQIMDGFQHDSVHVILDRAEAIQQVVLQATPDDVVLIAGKGHEDYQEIKGVKVPFRDEQVVLGVNK
ncbi:UDP-N-acetylmuramoylalanyl-D-glutamate--2,6-diaminopimelate ligase, partial [hydrothermal vent metagenome]